MLPDDWRRRPDTLRNITPMMVRAHRNPHRTAGRWAGRKRAGCQHPL